VPGVPTHLARLRQLQAEVQPREITKYFFKKMSIGSNKQSKN
jgi:hypothetical protein